MTPIPNATPITDAEEVFVHEIDGGARGYFVPSGVSRRIETELRAEIDRQVKQWAETFGLYREEKKRADAAEEYAAKIAGIEAERDLMRDALFRAHSSLEVMAGDLDMKHRERPLLDEIGKLLWGCPTCGGSGLDAPHTDRWCDACAGTGVDEKKAKALQ